MAGVSILHQVALKQNGLFKRQVEDILVNSFLENVTLDKNSPSYVWESLEAVNNINAFYNQTYICNSICLIKENIYFSNINGIEYKECNFYNVNFSNNVCYFRKCCFDKCTFLNTVVVFEFAQFNFCSLFNLAFASKDTNSYIQFFCIDFTGFKEWFVPTDIPLYFANCKYDPKNPPVEPLRTLLDEAKRREEAEDKASTESEASTPTTTPTNDDKQG